MDPPFIPMDWLTVGVYYPERLMGALIGKTFGEKIVATYSKNLKHKGIHWLKKCESSKHTNFKKNVRVE